MLTTVQSLLKLNRGLSNRGTETNTASCQADGAHKTLTLSAWMPDRGVARKAPLGNICAQKTGRRVSGRAHAGCSLARQALVQSSYHIYKCQDRIFIVKWTPNMRVLIFVFFGFSPVP